MIAAVPAVLARRQTRRGTPYGVPHPGGAGPRAQAGALAPERTTHTETHRRRGAPGPFHPASALSAVELPTPTAVVLAEVGTPSAADAAARYDGPNRPLATLVVPKTKSVPSAAAAAPPARAR